MWNLEPSILVPIALAALWYALGVIKVWSRAGRGHGVRRWQACLFAGGLFSLIVALVSPLDSLAASLFSAHMSQHMILILVAAPLLAISAPLPAFLWALPTPASHAIGRWWRRASAVRRIWEGVSHPAIAWVLAALALWIWHLPALYQATLRSETLHGVEHLIFLGSAMLYWWTCIYPRSRGRLAYGVGILSLFGMILQSSALGALITLAPQPWYPAYAATARAWGMTPLDDQQLAGLVMWVPGGLVYLFAASAMFVAWLGALERSVNQKEISARARMLPGTAYRKNGWERT